MRVAQTTPVQAEPAFRLNPFHLPACNDALTAGRPGMSSPAVYLDQSVAVVRRSVGGKNLDIKVPIRRYQGIAISCTLDDPAAPHTELVLIHRDPALQVVLSSGADLNEMSADWQAWARQLGLPLLVRDDDGVLQPARTYLGTLSVGTPRDRRPHAQFADRRPRFLVRRKTGSKAEQPVLKAREIIART